MIAPRRHPAQDHFRQPLTETPFHPRLAALCETESWYNWAGQKALHSVYDEELEYFAIRSTAAVFDISPMIKYRIRGPGAEAMLNRLTLRDVRKLAPGRVQYTAWCDDAGEVLDDGTLFRLGPQEFRLCSQGRHLPWILDTAEGFDCTVEDESEAIAGLALQGPASFAVLQAAGFSGLETLKAFNIRDLPHEGGQVTISRTGFTGDLGYELFCPAGAALSLWDRLWSTGAPLGLKPIGYNALDRARIEAGFIVPGTDFIPTDLALRADRARLPDEIGLDWLVDPAKTQFNGRRAIMAARAKGGPRHVLVGLDVEDNTPAVGAILYHRKKREAGVVSSAIWSPMLKRNIAIASLDAPYGSRITEDLWVEIYALRELRYHKLMKRARIVPRPFLKLRRRTMTPPGLV